MTDTATMIANQLAENTGTHFLDSGMARGRAWQRNQDRAAAHGQTVQEMFENQPAAYWDGYMVIMSSYHWMKEHLDYREDLDARFHRWINLGWVGLDRYADGPYTNAPSTVDAYIDRMVKRGWMEQHPEFDGWTNTYNHENILSQDLQFRCAALTDEHPLGPASIVFMSTHNGADARGGYSDFHIYECDPWEMFDWEDYSAHCPQCEVVAAHPDSTIFDEKPYVHESSGWWYCNHGEWSDPNGNFVTDEPIFDPRWPKPGLDLPDDFEQEGPLCPIHLCNMTVS
jgi:hypothetical protein